MSFGIGIIGCGNISDQYMALIPLFDGIDLRACADLNPQAAAAQAAKYNIRADSMEGLLAADDIDIVVNLTVPDAHFDVSRAILLAGKHAYSEKPFVLSVADGQALHALADERGLRIGSAPDTFLGGAHQQARAQIDSGALGRITSGTAMVMSHGMEHWHPNPGFFYRPGGGPILDLGPYYITNLVQLLGPVTGVGALSGKALETRMVTAENRSVDQVAVTTDTTIHALLEFASGAVITLIASWDVWAHRHTNMELYGTNGSLYVPDPNFFGGEVIAGGDAFSEMVPLPAPDHPFSVPNRESGSGAMMANYRAAGLADMAAAIRQGRAHRCSLELALHVIDVMTSVLSAGERRAFIPLSTTCQRPEALPPEAARALLR